MSAKTNPQADELSEGANYPEPAEWQQRLAAVAACASETGDTELAETAGLIVDLLQLSANLRLEGETEDHADQILNFCRQEVWPWMPSSDNGADTAADTIRQLHQTINDRWGDFLELLPADQRFLAQISAERREADDSGWAGVNTIPCDTADEDPESGLAVDLSAILQSLDQHTSGPADRMRQASVATRSAAEAEVLQTVPVPAADAIDDPELLAAFVDDAQQCLEAMEAALLDLESGEQTAEPARQFCRQLHTLKGASGTVGLNDLAAWLHTLENRVEEMAATSARLDVDVLLEGVDTVRRQMTALQSGGNNKSEATAPPELPSESQSRHSGSPRAVAGRRANDAPTDSAGRPVPSAASVPVSGKQSTTAVRDESGEHFIRLEASRLDQLMDLLAELVMLRNRRDTYVTTLQDLQRELNGCADRIRTLNASADLEASKQHRFGEDDRFSWPSADGTVQTSMQQQAAVNGGNLWLSRSMSELANDVSELGRSIREVSEPLDEDNSAVKHLIGRFRQNLMDLRRLPITGLFQRLQRTVRDAARAEDKQVQIQLTGQGTRVERSLQERLFEPLMHIVRNAVSHGIETAEERVAAGKPAAGTLTVDAWSDTAALTIEIRDDGRGLNDEVLEARGRELGLLPMGQPVSREQLWRLIFQPGFSTRSTVSQISGRGVGMDVVDSWIRSLRGRISVDSTLGQGTTFRLQIPLRSAIEHAMVVRVGGQLFALPMHAVEQTSACSVREPSPSAVPLHQLLGLQSGAAGKQTMLRLRPSGSKPTSSRSQDAVAIVVDAVVGVEEVVVRSLPPLLLRHELFSGVTLSGQAETVLLFDVPRLSELIERMNSAGATDSAQQNSATADSVAEPDQAILVTDDSVTIRRSLSRRLAASGYRTVEASDGLEAMKILRAGGIAAVVTDIDMPRTNGLELLAEIRSNDRYAGLPIIVLTARDDQATAARATELQAVRLLNKPVTDTTVSQIVSLLQKATS